MGRNQHEKEKAKNTFGYSCSETCPSCRGEGKRDGKKCSRCEGKGKVRRFYADKSFSPDWGGV